MLIQLVASDDAKRQARHGIIWLFNTFSLPPFSQGRVGPYDLGTLPLQHHSRKSFRQEEQKERKLTVTHTPSTYSRQNQSSVRIIYASEAYSRRNRSSLRNQDIIIKKPIYLTSSTIRHNNLNPTHENNNNIILR